MTYAEKVYS